MNVILILGLQTGMQSVLTKFPKIQTIKIQVSLEPI